MFEKRFGASWRPSPFAGETPWPFAVGGDVRPTGGSSALVLRASEDGISTDGTEDGALVSAAGVEVALEVADEGPSPLGGLANAGAAGGIGDELADETARTDWGTGGAWCGTANGGAGDDDVPANNGRCAVGGSWPGIASGSGSGAGQTAPCACACACCSVASWKC